jgi:small subunit ribosomal protein S20
MANIKAAIKDHRQNQKRAIRNRIYRGGARTAVRKARAALVSGNESAEALQEAIRALDVAASKGVIHKNNAARRKSRLMQAFHKAQASADAA